MAGWVRVNQVRDDSSGCTQLAILDLKQADADSAAGELLDSARQNGIDPIGLELIGVECDVVSEGSVKSAFDQTAKRFGKVDVVVASAGPDVVCITAPHELTSRKVSWRTTPPSSMVKEPFPSLTRS